MVSEHAKSLSATAKMGLNPCLNGRWSLTCNTARDYKMGAKVLILVLVEDGLWFFRLNVQSVDRLRVLILVLVEDGLWCLCLSLLFTQLKRLNPCFSGRWSLIAPYKSCWQTVTYIKDCSIFVQKSVPCLEFGTIKRGVFLWNMP